MPTEDVIKPSYTPKNYLNKAQYSQAVAGISDQLYSILSNHCGPTAAYAAWPSHNTTREITDTEFSKDGISIVNRLQYDLDSIEECIRSSVSYVGSRVNNSCHDGTTTAMMIIVGILREFFNHNSDSSKALAKLPPHRVTAMLGDTLDAMEAALDTSRITVSEYAELMGLTNDQARRAVTYAQAMISSKGDHELASALAELVAQTPVERLHGQYVLDHYIHESDTRVEVKSYDSDLSFRAMWCLPSTYNHNMDTDYKGTADLLVDHNSIIGGSMTTAVLLKIVRDAIRFLEHELSPPTAEELAVLEEDPGYSAPYLNPILDRNATDLVIVSIEIESNLIGLVRTLNSRLKNSGRKGQVALVQLANPNDLASPWYLKAIGALSEPRPYVGDICAAGMGVKTNLAACIIPDIDFHFKATRLYIGGLYEKDDGMYVPAYLTPEDERTDPTHPKAAYFALLNELEQLIARQQAAHDDEKVQEQSFMEYLTLYRHLVCQNWVTLKLGGTTHDLRALISVAEDTFGAVISAIDEGFIFGGIWRMMMNVAKCTWDASPMDVVVCNALRDVLEQTYGADFTDRHITLNNTVADDGTSGAHLADLVLHMYYHRRDSGDEIIILDKDTLKEQYTSFITAQHDEWPQALFQPIQGYYELIRRLRELLPGLLTTATYLTAMKR